MRHRLQRVPRKKRGPLLFSLLALTAALMVVLDRTLRGERYGIFALQLAGSVGKARRIVAAWDASGARERALFNVRLDFLFLVVYSTTAGLACILASEALRPLARWATVLGVALAWCQWLAALLDALENVALLRMLRGPVTEPWPRVARWSAIPKFALVAARVLYAAVGACAHLAQRDGRT